MYEHLYCARRGLHGGRLLRIRRAARVNPSTVPKQFVISVLMACRSNARCVWCSGGCGERRKGRGVRIARRLWHKSSKYYCLCMPTPKPSRQLLVRRRRSPAQFGDRPRPRHGRGWPPVSGPRRPGGSVRCWSFTPRVDGLFLLPPLPLPRPHILPLASICTSSRIHTPRPQQHPPIRK